MLHALVMPLLVLVIGLGLMGCASRTAEPLPEPASPEERPVYVLAPATCDQFLEDAESPPLLASEGLEEDLPVYPSSEQAREAIAEREARKQLPAGLWRVYRLEGNWDTDVVEPAPGEKRMRHPARLRSLEQDEDGLAPSLAEPVRL